MLGIDRNAARYTWTAALVLLAMSMVYLIRHTLFIFVIALLFAYLLSPLVDFLDRLFPSSRTRTPALALAYILVTGILIGGGFMLGTRAVDQANEFITRIPEVVGKAKNFAPKDGSWLGRLLENTEDQLAQRINDVLHYLPALGKGVISVAETLVLIVVVPIFSFFLLKDASSLRKSLLEMMGTGSHRELMEDLADDVNLLLAQYVRALALLCLTTFTIFALAAEFAGAPYPLLLAGIAAGLEFIPMVGPLTAAVLIIVINLIAGYPHILGVLAFLGIYRIFQDYVVAPRLMSAGMELHPLMVMFGVFAGAEVGGIPGTFLSVPAVAMIRIVYRRIEKARAGWTIASPKS
uniref:Permease n=1 Tax=uncultured bacterium 89 TaxID=698393 RepID=E3T684_9BACT|nr:hypothetical protein [uncultured bacterium 89]